MGHEVSFLSGHVVSLSLFLKDGPCVGERDDCESFRDHRLTVVGHRRLQQLSSGMGEATGSGIWLGSMGFVFGRSFDGEGSWVTTYDMRRTEYGIAWRSGWAKCKAFYFGCCFSSFAGDSCLLITQYSIWCGHYSFCSSYCS